MDEETQWIHKQECKRRDLLELLCLCIYVAFLAFLRAYLEWIPCGDIMTVIMGFSDDVMDFLLI